MLKIIHSHGEGDTPVQGFNYQCKRDKVEIYIGMVVGEDQSFSGVIDHL